MADFIQLPAAKLAYIRTELGERAGAERKTSMLANVITSLARDCEQTTGHAPVFDFKVTRNAAAILLEVTGVPCLSFGGAKAVMELYPRAVASMQFLFTNEQTLERLEVGCVRVSFWADVEADEEATSGAQKKIRERLAYEPIRVHKRLKHCVELDFTDLNTDGDDRATLEQLVACLMSMTRLMPEIHPSVEPLTKTSNGLEYAAAHTAAGSHAPKKRHRAGAANGGWSRSPTNGHHHGAVDDETALSDGDTRLVSPDDANHVGFCLFCANVPNFDYAFLEYLKKRFGNRILDMVVVAPAKWVNGSGAASDAIFTPAELAISVRRAACTEAESGEYALLGSNRLQRLMTRNAKAFGGVPCIASPIGTQ